MVAWRSSMGLEIYGRMYLPRMNRTKRKAISSMMNVPFGTRKLDEPTTTYLPLPTEVVS
jgi:hypothetical protein